MPRTNESSLRDVATFLKDTGLPASVNDIITANVVSKATAYRLFGPEKFAELALYGIVPINRVKPYFFAYNEKAHRDLLIKASSETEARLMSSSDVLLAASKQVAAGSTKLDDIETQVVSALRKFRAAYDRDDTLASNFVKDAVPVETYIDTQTNIREVLEADPTKFQAFILSAFVTMSKEL